MTAVFWPNARPINRIPDMVAAPAVYEVSIGANATAKFSFATLTRQIIIVAAGTVLWGLTEDGVDTGAGTGENRFPIGPDYPPFNVFVQTRNFYIRNETGGSIVVNVLVVQSDLPVPPGFGDICEDNGFDGGDSSEAVTNPFPVAP
jgi:hypothetical protein